MWIWYWISHQYVVKKNGSISFLLSTAVSVVVNASSLTRHQNEGHSPRTPDHVTGPINDMPDNSLSSNSLLDSLSQDLPCAQPYRPVSVPLHPHPRAQVARVWGRCRLGCLTAQTASHILHQTPLHVYLCHHCQTIWETARINPPPMLLRPWASDHRSTMHCRCHAAGVEQTSTADKGVQRHSA